MTGSKIITCHLGKWTAPPVCSDMRCAPPPEIYDGRILGAKQQRYLPGDRMHYQCGRGLSFIGSLTVTCEEGKWSQMPECKELCITSPEDMEKNNIGLKWSLEFRLNLESGDFVEFGCKNGYVRDPTSSAFRVKCVEGKLAYPKCKRRGTYE
ncbi:complement factor H-related protein 1-like [Caretta caretta]|uniref:complement factor H-related protein 1-like n=1 Tax=Caretta caretta TaxID=8467 RepID=UPI003F4BE738